VSQDVTAGGAGDPLYRKQRPAGWAEDCMSIKVFGG
jgi:hypothetical protein